MRVLKNISITLLSALILVSCEDKIDVETSFGEPQLVVNAWLNNLEGQQRINLSMSQAYFDNGPIPRVTGASVKVTELISETEYLFTDINNGDYIWQPTANEKLVNLDGNYKLEIIWEGNTFNAFARGNRTIPVDSITYEFEEVSTFNEKEGYSAELHGTDIAGAPDFYWIKTYKNNQLLNRPGLVNIAYDGAGGPGADGFPFIPPIRSRATDNDNLYQMGDSIKVEIYSIDREAFFFIQQAIGQLQNGGLFATPPENIRSNVINLNERGPKALGWFGTSLVESLAIKVE